MAGAMTAVTPGTWDYCSAVVPRQMRPRLVGDKIHKLAGVLPEDSVGFYRHLVTQWPEASSLVEGAAAPDESLYASAAQGAISPTTSHGCSISIRSPICPTIS